MTRWHIIDHRHLRRLAHLRRLHAVLLLALGITVGLMLDRFEGPVATAQASLLPTEPLASTPQAWCGTPGALQMSCGLTYRP